MKTSVEDISPVKKKLSVEIEAEEVNEKVNEAYGTLRKKAKIRGFRQGKIPKNIMERYFGNQVAEQVTKDLVSETLPKAVEQTEITPLNMPAIENDALKIGQNFRYSAIMEVRPEFELKDYMGLEAEKEICSVTDEDVDRHLEEIRRNKGDLRAIDEDRGVKETDYVIIEYEGFENDQALEGIKSENFELRMGSNDFHPDFEKALIGLKKGDGAEIKVRYEDNHHHSKLVGKEIDFKVKVIDIKVMDLPELNDDFATNLGADIADLDSLKKMIKEDITAREEKRIGRDLEKKLLKEISDTVDFELPASLVESEIRFGIENIRQNLERSGSNLEKSGLSEERLRKEFRPASENRVKEKLILGEIARQNDLTINEMELTESFREMAENMGQDLQVVRRYYEANQLVDSLKQGLLEEKTLNFLVKGAKFKELAPDKMSRKQE